MARYCLNTPEVKKTKKILLKYNQFEVKNQEISGVIKITNWRTYRHYDEVDIIFDGIIWATFQNKKQWIDSSVLRVPNVSLIRCNKMIRRRAWKELRHFLNYFGIYLKTNQYVIKKLKWI